MTIPASLSLPPEDGTSPGPFEGPEKLLEIWFAPSIADLPDEHVESEGKSVSVSNQKRGLRKVPRKVWEDMLDIVKCKVLSVVEGEALDAYLLSESSLFVAPHLLVLKTCGTTLNLLGLYRIIEIAREYCGYTDVWRCFYSRKSFFFPERQSGPHKDWRDEVNFLDSVFGSAGSAYTVGPMNRDHWLLYLTSPNTRPILPSDKSLTSTSFSRLRLSSPASPSKYQDHTLEILMTHLSSTARQPFLTACSSAPGASGHDLGTAMSAKLGVENLFSKDETRLDSYGFEPCGYSANAVIGTGMPEVTSDPRYPGGGYYTIHVTPEDGWSYASFECNVPLPLRKSRNFPPNPDTPSSATMSRSTSQDSGDCSGSSGQHRPDLRTLIRNVVEIFQPGRLSITLFVSTQPADQGGQESSDIESKAWEAFGPDFLGKEYERKDRIGYEFDGYDLVFACFQQKGFEEASAGQIKTVDKVSEESLTTL